MLQVVRASKRSLVIEQLIKQLQREYERGAINYLVYEERLGQLIAEGAEEEREAFLDEARYKDETPVIAFYGYGRVASDYRAQIDHVPFLGGISCAPVPFRIVKAWRNAGTVRVSVISVEDYQGELAKEHGLFAQLSSGTK